MSVMRYICNTLYLLFYSWIWSVSICLPVVEIGTLQYILVKAYTVEAFDLCYACWGLFILNLTLHPFALNKFNFVAAQAFILSDHNSTVSTFAPVNKPQESIIIILPVTVTTKLNLFI